MRCVERVTGISSWSALLCVSSLWKFWEQGSMHASPWTFFRRTGAFDTRHTTVEHVSRILRARGRTCERAQVACRSYGLHRSSACQSEEVAFARLGQLESPVRTALR